MARRAPREPKDRRVSLDLPEHKDLRDSRVRPEHKAPRANKGQAQDLQERKDHKA